MRLPAVAGPLTMGVGAMGGCVASSGLQTITDIATDDTAITPTNPMRKRGQPPTG